MRTIDLIKSSKKVEHVDDERAIGNGVIVTLRRGWTFSAGQDNRVSGEDTASLAMESVRQAKPFDGPYED